MDTLEKAGNLRPRMERQGNAVIQHVTISQITEAFTKLNLNESYEDSLVKEPSGATGFAVDGGNLPGRFDVGDELLLEVSHEVEVIVISDDSEDELLVEAPKEVIDIADDSDDEPILQVTLEVIEISDDSDDELLVKAAKEVIDISDDSDYDPILEVNPEVIEISDDSAEEVEPDQVGPPAVSEEAAGPNGSLFSDDHIQYTYAVSPDHTYCKVISSRPMEIVSDEPKEDLSIQPVDNSAKTHGEIVPYDLDLDYCLFDGIAEIVPCPSLDEIVLEESSLETNLSLDQLMELYLGAE